MPKAGDIRPFADRFAEKWMPEPNTGCWLWLAGTNEWGYGTIWSPPPKKCWLASRASYMLHIGPIPPGLCVLHRCDTPPCVNPDHLFLGTNRDNVADRHAKGRSSTARGERAGLSKLTEAGVLELRRLRGIVPVMRLAARFGVSEATIRCVQNRTTWKHVSP